MIKVIKKIEGASDSQVHLVKIDGTLWIRKKVDPSWVIAEKQFYKELKTHGIPTLKTIDHPDLNQDELLIEYIATEKTIADSEEEIVFKKWGKLLSDIHSIKYQKCFNYLENGDKSHSSWKDLMKKYADVAYQRADSNNWYGFSKKTKEHICLLIDKVTMQEPENLVLIHGDPHSNNFLLTDETIYAFDKNDSFFSGCRYLDLAIIFLDFPNGNFINTSDSDHLNDLKKLKAFSQGYGVNLLEKEELYLYIVLVAFRRMSSPFAKFNREVIESVTKKLN